MPSACPRGTSVNSALLTKGRLGQGIQAVVVLDVSVGNAPAIVVPLATVRHGAVVLEDTSLRVEFSDWVGDTCVPVLMIDIVAESTTT
jgi:hypothetical protein